MPIEQSERNWLERLADVVPGVAGYREKEGRRDTDKRLREYLAHCLDDCVRRAENAREKHFESKGLAGLDSFGRLLSGLRTAADALRFATYGYSGFFDQIKVREEELDRIYQFDVSLLHDVRIIEASITRLETAGSKDAAAQVETLRRKIGDRKHLLETFAKKPA